MTCSSRGRMVHSNEASAWNIPVVHSSRMEVNSPCSSAGLEKSIVANNDVAAAKNRLSAMLRPGQVRRPKPKTTARGSSTSVLGASAPSALTRRKRSGWNKSGEGYTAGSLRKALPHAVIQQVHFFLPVQRTYHELAITMVLAGMKKPRYWSSFTVACGTADAHVVRYYVSD
jgi:hypothetical protein